MSMIEVEVQILKIIGERKRDFTGGSRGKESASNTGNTGDLS